LLDNSEDGNGEYSSTNVSVMGEFEANDNTETVYSAQNETNYAQIRAPPIASINDSQETDPSVMASDIEQQSALPPAVYGGNDYGDAVQPQQPQQPPLPVHTFASTHSYPVRISNPVLIRSIIGRIAYKADELTLLHGEYRRCHAEPGSNAAIMRALLFSILETATTMKEGLDERHNLLVDAVSAQSFDELQTFYDEFVRSQSNLLVFAQQMVAQREQQSNYPPQFVPSDNAQYAQMYPVEEGVFDAPMVEAEQDRQSVSVPLGFEEEEMNIAQEYFLGMN